MKPTLEGFLAFIQGQMQIPVSALPTTQPEIQGSFDMAMTICNDELQAAGGMIYTYAVYNLAGDYLLNFCPDQVGQTFFADARTAYKINSFVPGVITSTGDNGDSSSFANPEWTKNMSLADLQNLKTPYGRQYMAFAQRYGTLWGIS